MPIWSITRMRLLFSALMHLTGSPGVRPASILARWASFFSARVSADAAAPVSAIAAPARIRASVFIVLSPSGRGSCRQSGEPRLTAQGRTLGMALGQIAGRNLVQPALRRAAFEHEAAVAIAA